MKYFYSMLWMCAALVNTPVFAGGDVDSARGKEENFSGVITYDVAVESKTPLASDDMLRQMYGSTAKLYIGSGGYKLVFEGDSSIEVLFRIDENRQYLRIGERDSLLWRTADNYDSKFIATRSTENSAIIMDRHCDSYTIETDWGAITYFYDPSIKMDPKPYKGHGFNYFNVYLRHARSPYLKYLYDGPSMKMTLTARDIEERQLDNLMFEPEQMPLASLDLLPSTCPIKTKK